MAMEWNQRTLFVTSSLPIFSGGSAGLKSLQVQKGMFRYLGSTPRKHHFNAKASLDVSDEGTQDDDYDSELEIDELACFRGLVLDISYRGSFLPSFLNVPHPHVTYSARFDVVSTNLSRRSVLLRDNFTCQYCRARDNLTIDHVTACAKCNSKKGRKTPEEANMTLIKVPKAPKDYDILAIPLTSAAIQMFRTRNGTPEEWPQYLSSSMEP
ncbi:putative TATA-box binding protein [Hibiscus syriacus]|uniref:TATA-box binding protein n=1 Tax=Hibiscus syriacus TaxID=106335 RepID=A0A6A2YZ12_HIBSY|nr:putative TATA-box binding protein [Hibiscus syriacus]